MHNNSITISKKNEYFNSIPHSIEAEQSVLGGLMLDNNSWESISDILISNDFYVKSHQIIYSFIAKLSENNAYFDIITLSDVLEKNGHLKEIGGLGYLGDIAKNIPHIANITAYAKIIKEHSILRELLLISSKITTLVNESNSKDSLFILNEAEKMIFSVSNKRQEIKTLEPINEITPSIIKTLEEIKNNKNFITGLQTQYLDLDNLTAGLHKSDLIIIAGRPSMGKSAFAINIAENIAMKAKLPILVFSMEMSKSSIIMRIISSLSKISQNTLRKGNFSDLEWEKILSTISYISNDMNIYIDDTPALTPYEIRSRARRISRKHNGLSLIIIDYLQLMQINNQYENRVNEVSAISRNLKGLAKELNVPVIALSQLSRKCEERANKRPMLSDLRESGAIEQDADLIIFIYREELYNKQPSNIGIAEIIIGKQRNGPIGTLKLCFLGEHCRFENYSNENIIFNDNDIYN